MNREVNDNNTSIGEVSDGGRTEASVERTPMYYGTMRVKTKVEDGGSKKTLSSTKGEPDAFAIFSNDIVRMLHLRGLEDGAGAGAANEGQEALLRRGGEAAAERKTRLTTELHISALYIV